MTTLEKLGVILTAFALKFSLLDANKISIGSLVIGSVLLLTGEHIEKWLRKTYPNVRW